MNQLGLEIESLVLDGVPLKPQQGRRLADLTEIALTRLLHQRGAAARFEVAGADLSLGVANPPPASIRLPAGANEARWAEELALVIYQALDRTL